MSTLTLGRYGTYCISTVWMSRPSIIRSTNQPRPNAMLKSWRAASVKHSSRSSASEAHPLNVLFPLPNFSSIALVLSNISRNPMRITPPLYGVFRSSLCTIRACRSPKCSAEVQLCTRMGVAEYLNRCTDVMIDDSVRDACCWLRRPATPGPLLDISPLRSPR
ncbi:hypothetical protein OBBRIDRAFT_314365 [Obba rivulosa]|uniref:Uncharacterized protein n=1 Tax=Obba rivulosa TaxID=1052685 RepID=A0A8E2AIZ3_9APHY|nr:hypothetical protein OBBRIDRAFT_314365 [Obba rivulosa]